MTRKGRMWLQFLRLRSVGCTSEPTSLNPLLLDSSTPASRLYPYRAASLGSDTLMGSFAPSSSSAHPLIQQGAVVASGAWSPKCTTGAHRPLPGPPPTYTVIPSARHDQLDPSEKTPLIVDRLFEGHSSTFVPIGTSVSSPSILLDTHGTAP